MVPFPNSASRPQSNPTLNHHSSPARRTLHRYVLEHSPQNYLSLLPRSARSMSDGDDHHDDFEPAKSDVSWAPQSSKLPLGRLPFAFPFSFFTNASQRALTLAPPPPPQKNFNLHHSTINLLLLLPNLPLPPQTRVRFKKSRVLPPDYRPAREQVAADNLRQRKWQELQQPPQPVSAGCRGGGVGVRVEEEC